MINYNLPKSIEIDGEQYPITNDGDYRVILDVICALNDEEIPERTRPLLALAIFYGESNIPQDLEKAIAKMKWFMDCGEEHKQKEDSPKLMDWEQDFPMLVSPLNKILGYDVRGVPYLHWWTFISGYQEIGQESTFATVIRIRQKMATGKQLDKSEEAFLRENRDLIVFDTDGLSEAYLNGDLE